MGSVARLQEPQIAIVGSRKATSGGLDNAQAFAKHLAASGFTITSGMALGIDASAHAGALQSGPCSIGVLGCGIDVVYPIRNRHMFQQMLASGGALLSEFPLGTPAIALNFPQRNRIISGLSLGVLVVEAAIKSGSLITARLALQQGREVFAIPGSIHNPQSKGCHHLIKEGATLVESSQDLLNELKGLLALKFDEAENLSLFEDDIGSRDGLNLDDQERSVLAALGHDPSSFDTLLYRTGLSVESLSRKLSHLELQGVLTQGPYGYEVIAAKT